MRYLMMLEDDLDRIRRFKSIVATHHPNARIDVYRTALAFIERILSTYFDSMLDLS